MPCEWRASHNVPALSARPCLLEGGMGIGRICGGFWTHPKRIHLEAILKDHKWATAPPLAMCGAECCGRILAWLDGLNDPEGAIEDFSLMASVAGFSGPPEMLMSALLEAGLVEHTEAGWKWHDFKALNARPIRQRLYRRGNEIGNLEGNIQGNLKAGSGSGSGTGSKISSSESPSEPLRTRPAGAGLLLKKLWNEGAKESGLPEVTRMGEWRSKRAGLLLTACGAPGALEATVRIFQAWPFARDHRLSIDTLLRARGREKYVEWGQTFLAGTSPHDNGLPSLSSLIGGD